MGHACFDVALPDGRRLVVDPYQAGDFGGRIALQPLVDAFDLVASTHPHRDHAAFDAVPSARRVAPPYADPGLQLTSRVAAHDELGGRLRGGLIELLDLRAGGVRVVFCGDLGERPVGATLQWLCAPRVDVLVVPVGGYFTMGADAAAELVAMARPKVVIPCHAQGDGATFEELQSAERFVRRLGAPNEHERLDAFAVPDANEGGASQTRLVRLIPQASPR